MQPTRPTHIGTLLDLALPLPMEHLGVRPVQNHSPEMELERLNETVIEQRDNITNSTREVCMYCSTQSITATTLQYQNK